MEENLKPMPVVIEASQYAELKKISEKEGLKILWMVNKAVSEWLDRRKKA